MTYDLRVSLFVGCTIFRLSSFRFRESPDHERSRRWWLALLTKSQRMGCPWTYSALAVLGAKIPLNCLLHQSWGEGTGASFDISILPGFGQATSSIVLLLLLLIIIILVIHFVLCTLLSPALVHLLHSKSPQTPTPGSSGHPSNTIYSGVTAFP